MKVLNYTVKVHPAEEGGFWAEVPALPGCFTQGETIEKGNGVSHLLSPFIKVEG